VNGLEARMKVWNLVVVTVVGLVSAAVAPPPTPPASSDLPSPPDRIESHLPDRAAPVWVSAERAVDERQQLVAELFAPLEWTLLQQQLTGERSWRRAGLIGSPGDPCRGARGVDAEYYVLNPTLADLVAHSEVAFSGTVRGGRPGFYRGDPRQLYRVEVDHVWIDTGNLQSGDTVYVAFEEAQIRVGDDWLCVRGPRYPVRPMPGKRILVFSWHAPWGEQPVFSPMDVELFFEGKDGLSVPGHLVAELESPRWSDLEATVASLVAGSGGER
jgi:hypothetical protein